MKTYLFRTAASMKPYNCRKWYITDDIIKNMEISAENLRSALEKYREIVADEHYISISNNAMKTKEPMFRDYKDGTTKQDGFVITAKSDFQDDSGKWSEQYIELWVSIREIAFCDFEEIA